MRKQYKDRKIGAGRGRIKKYKKGFEKRWTLKDMISLKEFEYLKKQSIDNNQAI